MTSSVIISKPSTHPEMMELTEKCSRVNVVLCCFMFYMFYRDACCDIVNFTFLSKTSLDHPQAVQNAAAKLLTKSSKRSHVTSIDFSSLVAHQIQNSIPVSFADRALHGPAPASILDLLQPYITAGCSFI